MSMGMKQIKQTRKRACKDTESLHAFQMPAEKNPLLSQIQKIKFSMAIHF